MYESKHLNTECQPCDPGYISDGGDSGCYACDPGTYSVAGYYCEECEEGTYSVFAAEECTPCPAAPDGLTATTKKDWYNPDMDLGDELYTGYYACHIKANSTASDLTGTYTFTDDCWYTD